MLKYLRMPNDVKVKLLYKYYKNNDLQGQEYRPGAETHNWHSLFGKIAYVRVKHVCKQSVQNWYNVVPQTRLPAQEDYCVRTGKLPKVAETN